MVVCICKSGLHEVLCAYEIQFFHEFFMSETQ